MPATRIYVGNLPFSSTATDLSTIFSHYGEVRNVDLIVKKGNGRPRGFAYVEMACCTAAELAIREMDGATLSGRPLRVAAARPRTNGSTVVGPEGLSSQAPEA